MLSNVEVNCCSLLIFTVFVPSCTICRIFQVVCAISTFEILLNSYIEYRIHNLTIKACCFFFSISPLYHRSGRSFLTNFHRHPYLLIQKFQEGFHSHLLVGVVIPIELGIAREWLRSMTARARVKDELKVKLPKQELTHFDTTSLFV